MRLVLDVGNTAVKWACFDNGGQGTTGRFVYRAGDIGALADVAWSCLQPAEEVLIASVAGQEAETALVAWFTAHWQVQPVFMHTTAYARGVTNAYTEPETLGIDRWAALVAAHHAYPGAVCVVDCGTAVTLDLVTAEGIHHGGLILPGIGLMQQLLSQKTAQLQLSEMRQAISPLAVDTAAGIISGAAYMAAAAIDHSVADMRAQKGADIDIVLTGGDAGLVLSLLRGRVHHVVDLVLRGIILLAGDKG